MNREKKKISISAFDEALSKPLMTSNDSDSGSVASTMSSSTSSSYRKSLPAGFAANINSSRGKSKHQPLRQLEYEPPEQSTPFMEQKHNQQEMINLEGGSSDLDAELARERAAEMSTITGSMRTIKKIYEDLAVIVDEQQDDIDDIEMNASQTMARAEEGVGQLEKAAMNSKSNQRHQSRCITFLLITGIVTIGFFIVQASIKHHHHRN